ncbi:MAG TPA: hypothetical protein VII72_06130 [Myxococcota bacterium]|jgi:hypothetical protein
MKSARLALLAALLATGCSYRGPSPGFAIVSTRALSVPMTVIAEEVEGRACIGGPAKDRFPEAEAVAVALRNAPGANALVNARFEKVGFLRWRNCTLLVRGTAVRIEPR